VAASPANRGRSRPQLPALSAEPGELNNLMQQHLQAPWLMSLRNAIAEPKMGGIITRHATVRQSHQHHLRQVNKIYCPMQWRIDFCSRFRSPASTLIGGFAMQGTPGKFRPDWHTMAGQPEFVSCRQTECFQISRKESMSYMRYWS
jgi:hypothetical protein